MTLSYMARLLFLCLGCFFVLHLAVGAAVALFARPALRVAERRKPRVAARLLLTLRLLPTASALLLIVALCVPSYLRLEPSTSSGEEVGFLFLGVALAGATLVGTAAARAFAASLRSWRYIRDCRRAACLRRVLGRPVWVMEGTGIQLMLTGLFHPAIVISRRVVESLPPSQLDAALRHEYAHWTSRDNLKRLLLLLAPGGFFHARALEDGWSRASELAADDRAVAGDPERSLSLAAALVAVSRLGTPAASPALATALLAGSRHLAARVDRLLAPVPPAEDASRGGALWTAGAALLAASTLLLIAQPKALANVHALLELLAH